MGIPVGELARRISSRELTEYIAYAGLEPFGPQQLTLHAGVIASAIVGSMTGKSMTPAEVFPSLAGNTGRSEQQTNEQILAIMNAIAAASHIMYGTPK